MRGVTGQHSLFSRHRASSVERELARTPYAFTPKPREPTEPPDLLNQRLIGPDLTNDDPETLKRAREQILDPFEDDINVRLAKERLFGGYSRSGSRAPSPSIFPSNADFDKRLKKEDDHFENALFGPNVNFDTNSNFSEKLSDTSSIRTNNLDNDRLSEVLNFDNGKLVQNNLRVKRVTSRNDNPSSVKSRSNSGSDKSSILSDRSNPSAPLPKDNRRISDASSNASANPEKQFKTKQVAIQRNFGSDRSGSLEIIDTVEEVDKNEANDKVDDVKKRVKVEEEPAFKLREFVHLKTDFDESYFFSRQDSLKVSRQGLEKYKKSRALAEGLTRRFYRNIYREYGGSADSGGSAADEGRRKPFDDEDVLTTSQFSQRIGKEPLENAEAFKVLGIASVAAQSSIDLESISSTASSFKVPPAVRAHRVTAFAILGETVPAPPSESPVADLPPLPVVAPVSAPSGRVSPFRGKGFKPDPLSRHTTPRTSRASSPQRSRANSVTKAEVMAKVQARQTTSFDRSQTPLRDYIKENIHEVKELSEFNREKNEQLAEQKRVEEEIEIMKELGLIDSNLGNKYPNLKLNLRSRSSSPTAILRFENIPVPNSRIINSRDGLERLGRKPIVVKASPRSVPSSQPHSKSGSPQHNSKIPRRQTSMSPPRDGRDDDELPSIMSNALAADGRFISNSTSSINDSRVFSVIMDQENQPIDVSPVKVRSKSSSNLIPGPSILKAKPPKSPGKGGPPPTNKNLSAKRLSPIVSTPDKSPTPSKSSLTGITDSKSPLSSSRSPIPNSRSPISNSRSPLPNSRSLANSRSPVSNDRNAIPNNKGPLSNSRSPIPSSRISAQDKSKTKDSMSRGTKRPETRSKPPTPNTMSPSRIPKRPSKSLVTSPNASRAPSRAASRGPPSRDISPNKKTSTGSKLNNLPKTPKAKSPSSMYRIEKNSIDSESNDSEKKLQLKRTNSRTSMMSKKGPSGSKPELKRANSKTSLIKPLSRTNSIKSINEKPGITARRKSSMKDLQETIEEGSSKGKGTGKNKITGKKKIGAPKDDQTETDDVLKQDNETQYDKQSQLEMSMDRLIPLTKNNVVSMTTAAITSQPLEIAAKVTSQLPATFEKAREKRELERISSSESIAAAAKLAEAAKIAEASKSSDTEKNGETKGLDAKLLKTASKTSLLSVKEDKEPMKRSDSIILHNNLKLKPIKTPLDPKVEKVKKKIDNILNSSQSSFEDIREKVKKADKVATDKANLEIEKATEKANQEIEKATEKANQEIEKATEKANHEIEKATLKASEAVEKSVEKVEEVVKKANESVAMAEEKMAIEVDKNLEQLKNDANEKMSEEIKSASKQTEAVVSNVESILNGSKNGVEKSMTPVETVTKAEVLKPSDLTNKSNPIELVRVKEDIIKKETLLPVVTVVNERPRGKIAESMDEKEHMTESVVRGEPDVEVQSGNIPVSSKILDRKKEAAKLGSLGDSHSTASGVANGASSNGAKLPESNGSLESDRDGKDLSTTGGAEKKGLCGKLWPPACCRSHNQSEVHLIDEKLNKKRKSEVSHGTVGSKKDEEKKRGICWRMCCCCCNKKDQETEKEGAKIEKEKKIEVGAEAEKKKWCDRFVCCRGKNKVSDSSVSMGDQPSLISGAPRPSLSKKEPSSSLCCCCRKKKDDWADRRDSILSQPQNDTSWWRKLACCKKKEKPKDPSLDASRRPSMFSKKRSLSQAVPLEDKRFKLDTSLIEHTSMLRGAIPALPVPLAWLCLLCNFLIPGLGTVCSGLFCLCFGRPRFGVYDGWKPRIGAFLIDLIVGVGQLFTVLFCLVGWGWSIWWATIMIRVARKYKKFKMTSPDPEQAQPTTNNHRAHVT